MIFSVQNNNLMFSVEFSVDLVQIQVRETVCGVFLARMDIPIQVWHMVEVMRRDFNEHHITQVTPTENQLGEMQMMEEVAEHVGMNYPEIPDSRYVAQPFDDFFFLWTAQLQSKRIRGSLSQELQSENHQLGRQDQLCAPLRTCKVLRTQLLDSSLICK